MAEVDWDEVLIIIQDLIAALNDASGRFCEAKYFKACLDIDGKIRPIVVELKRDAKARKRVKELAEESPELAEEGEEEIPELEITAEQRARLMEEEL